ncbi:hypothetical protein CL55_00003280 [Polynucleobacter duraquae]|uniref:O-Antigen ligase n=1 Tax=Polynucleobacter duraquae TaxID=1835254 RepID=A0A0E3ZKJ7_9BURK|nr:hypothetical protein [Polynucleobacter duraquae]AKD24661.1 hypothetical protein CL55_00003280 [Polynucleobacter duraquae]
MNTQYKYGALLILTLFIGLIANLDYLQMHTHYVGYASLLLFSIMAIISPAFSLGWLIISSVLIEKIGIISGQYLQTKCFLIITVIGIIYYINSIYQKKEQLNINKFKIFLNLTLFTFLFLLMIKIQFKDIYLLYEYLISSVTSKLSDNTNAFYYVMIIRWSAIVVVTALIIKEFEQLDQLIMGITISGIGLLFSLDANIFNGIYLLCSGTGGEGVQNLYINRADYAFKLSLSLYGISALLIMKLRNNVLLAFIFSIFIITLLVTGGKGGLLGYILCVFIGLIYLRRWRPMLYIPIVLTTLYFIITPLKICNPNVFLTQHFSALLTKGVMVRLSLYDQSLERFENNIPQKNSNELSYNLYTPLLKGSNESYGDFVHRVDQHTEVGVYRSGSGSHNVFIDIINQYGLIIGLLLIFIIIFPILILLYKLYINKMTYYLLTIFGFIIIIFLYANITAALHVAILVPLVFSMSISALKLLIDD